MAVVRFSAELKNDIITNARRLFEDRLSMLNNAPPDIGDRIITRLFGEVDTALKVIPSGFFSNTESFYLESIGAERYGYRFKTSAPFPAPSGNVQLSLGSIQGAYIPDVKLLDRAEWDDIKTEIDEWRRQIDALEGQQTQFVYGVSTVIEAHATLAPALKAWPPLWDLVPEEAKERHRKIVERKPTEAVDTTAVDLNKLTATVAAAKIMGK